MRTKESRVTWECCINGWYHTSKAEYWGETDSAQVVWTNDEKYSKAEGAKSLNLYGVRPLVAPVLKHGLGSLSDTRCQDRESDWHQYGARAYQIGPERWWTMPAQDEARGNSGGGPSALLMCKSFVWCGYRCERLIEPPNSWFPPNFPSG